ncbi:hypothetical protein AJ87_05455 [Rhizobium yanglingense]|nr:hypothetical protein AJ87_05455 [Rhizobium yanglingense]
MLANKEAERFFKDVKYVVFDELHSLVTSKRGHMLSLGLARLRRLAPGLSTIGLSATVAEPIDLQKWLVAQEEGRERHAGLVTVKAAPSRIFRSFRRMSTSPGPAIPPDTQSPISTGS